MNAYITSMTREGDNLILDGLHIDGPGAGSIGPKAMREMTRAFGKAQGAKKVTIRGGMRTTGAGPGRKPREIEIEVPDDD